MDRERITELREQANTPMKHNFPEGIIGGSCHRCGASSARTHKCNLPSDVRIARDVLLELLDIAERSVDDHDK